MLKLQKYFGNSLIYGNTVAAQQRLESENQILFYSTQRKLKSPRDDLMEVRHFFSVLFLFLCSSFLNYLLGGSIIHGLFLDSSSTMPDQFLSDSIIILSELEGNRDF